jgi:hypothetical protein
MTGDRKAIGTKFGMAFSGKWVWNMKDKIDTSFMKLFDPVYLFKDYHIHGTKYPIENKDLFENEFYGERSKTEKIKENVFKMQTK